MIDNHPAMIEGYKSILAFNDLDLDIKSTVAYNCETALHIVSESNEANTFDFAFIELKVPYYNNLNGIGCKEVAIAIKKKSPKCKIVILMSFIEETTLNSVFNSIRPNGILVKSDFSADEFLLAFERLYKNQSYYSKTVLQFLDAARKEATDEATAHNIPYLTDFTSKFNS